MTPLQLLHLHSGRSPRRKHRLVRAAAAILVASAWLAASPPAEAYIGPGAGFAVLGSFLALFVAMAAALLTLVTLPFRLLLAFFRGRKAYKRAMTRRVVVLGLDGLDPRRTARLMKEGRLPHFVELAEQGGFQPLGTTYPALSPVAWSSFATGVHPSRHAMYDFLDRDLGSYAPILSSSSVEPPARTLDIGPWRIPLGKPRIRLLRRSKAFWKILGEHGVFSSVLRVPITFPPEKFRGVCLSAMCTPDVRGTQGSFTHVSDAPAGEATGGLHVPAERRGDTFHARIPGPPDPVRKDGELLEIDVSLTPHPDGTGAEAQIGDETVTLRLREHSDWVSVVFRASLGLKVRGICRLRLMALEPHLSLYLTPIQIDPDKPALPISHPRSFATYLSRLLGRYSTLGLAEDTWALNEKVLDDEGFLEQAWLIHEEREALFFNGLRTTRRGLVAQVFDITDRVQHMFYRYQSPDHPAREDGSETHEKVIDELYERMDDLLRRTMEALGDDTVLFVVSDHGFTEFRRCVDLNAWLRDEGYLTLKDDARTSGEYFEQVDWERTRAYTFGLSGIYLNLRGREAGGIVDPTEAAELVEEIAGKLGGLLDPETDEVAVREAYPTARLYPGPYLDQAPELVVGYNEGYRAAWESALGQVTGSVFSDNTKAWSGDHCVDPALVPGVLFCNRRFDAEEPHLVDLAPTILRLFGVEPPGWMEGTPIFEAAPRAAEGEERSRWKEVATG